jgi:hypothetical protein
MAPLEKFYGLLPSLRLLTFSRATVSAASVFKGLTIGIFAYFDLAE